MKTGYADRALFPHKDTNFTQIREGKTCWLQDYLARTSDSRQYRTPISHLLQLSGIVQR